MKRKIREALLSRYAWLWLALVYLVTALSEVINDGWTRNAWWDLGITGFFVILFWVFGPDKKDADGQDS